MSLPSQRGYAWKRKIWRIWGQDQADYGPVREVGVRPSRFSIPAPCRRPALRPFPSPAWSGLSRSFSRRPATEVRAGTGAAGANGPCGDITVALRHRCETRHPCDEWHPRPLPRSGGRCQDLYARDDLGHRSRNVDLERRHVERVFPAVAGSKDGPAAGAGELVRGPLPAMESLTRPTMRRPGMIGPWRPMYSDPRHRHIARPWRGAPSLQADWPEIGEDAV